MRRSHCAGMIWSVSMSARSITTALPNTSRTPVIVPAPASKAAEGSEASRASQILRQREVAGDRRRGRDDRRHEVRAPTGSLPSLEVAIRGRGAALARAEDVRVHAEAHRAARAPPFEPRVAEHAVESLALGLRLDLRRARHHERAHAGTHAPTAHHLRGGAKVFDARIRARAEEHRIHRDVAHRGARPQVHVAERAARSGTRSSMPTVCAGFVPHDTYGRSSLASIVTAVSNAASTSVASARQASNAASHCAPFGACGRPSTYAKVTSSGAIMPARAPASIDMLQTVMRPSIDSARIASPAYSIACPVPPAVPISPMMARMMSLAATPAGSLPSTVTRMFLAFDWISVWVESTCSTSDVPMQ